jgi:hypothetical protein
VKGRIFRMEAIVLGLEFLLKYILGPNTQLEFVCDSQLLFE